MPHKYTEEEIQYLKEITEGRSYQEITDLFNKRFNTNQSITAIGSTLKRNRILNGRVTTFKAGESSWCKGIPRAEWLTPEQLEHVRAHQFKKVGGQVRGRDRKPGEERITKDGYIEVRMDGPIRRYSYNGKPYSHYWKFKHVLVWEAVNGPVPKGHKIMFLDGNPKNLNIENLVLITHAEMAQLNRLGYYFKDHPDLTQIGLDLVRIRQKLKEGTKDAK